MYVYVYKYCFIPSGCINIFLMSYLFIYIYSFTPAGNCRYEEVLRVILRHVSWSWTAASVPGQPASGEHPGLWRQWVDQKMIETLQFSGGTIDGNTSENSQPKNLHLLNLLEQTWIWDDLGRIGNFMKSVTPTNFQCNNVELHLLGNSMRWTAHDQRQPPVGQVWASWLWSRM